MDIGSYDVNGTYKQFFRDEFFEYTGLDMVAGDNVDIVPKNPYKWSEIEDNSYDVVISGQVLEHAEFFWITLAEISRVVREGGKICIIAPRGFELHRYPVDCYRFDTDGMVALARYCNLTPLHVSTNLAPVGASPDWYSETCADSMLIAEKPHSWKGLITPEGYTFEEIDLVPLQLGFVENLKAPYCNHPLFRYF